MGRSKAVSWRAACQALRAGKPYSPTPAFLGVGNLHGARLRPVNYPCPYCTRDFPSEAKCLRHIVLDVACRKKHKDVAPTKTRLLRLSNLQAKRDKPPLNVPNAEAPPPPPSIHASTSSPGAEAAPPATPEPGEPGTNNDEGRPEENSYRDGVFVEPFPDRRAGAPISDNSRPMEDLHTYLQARGQLGKQANFETMEMLMTTGLTNAGRDRHLKSRMVSLRTLQTA
jgi:hypothetical protein